MSVLVPHARAVPPTSPAAAVRTPHLVLDVDLAVQRYAELGRALPRTRLHYAVKANPHPELLARLVRAGAAFDVASPAEVEACLDAGADPGDLLYSNPVTSARDLGEAAAAGVRLFVVDAAGQVAKLAACAPGADVLVRIITSGRGSDWPLSRKYGCPAEDAPGLLQIAACLGLRAAGVSFHVGSQQRDPSAWEDPIADAAWVFETARRLGMEPTVLDVGGGFPAGHDGGAPPLAAYGGTIERALDRHFAQRPLTLAEPGRGVSGDAGTVVASVIGIVERAGQRWVFLDAGVFTGLVETLDEAIRYRIATDRDGSPVGPCVLAGPTCDSADVLYERRPVELPLDLREGDEVRLLSAGAYTSCYSTVGFNGFPPLQTLLRAPRA